MGAPALKQHDPKQHDPKQDATDAVATIAAQGDVRQPHAAHEAKSLLRFLTCGSVDDGKSTLIGRMLYDCGAVFDDQLDALDKDSKKFGTDGANLDFALLVDGLSAEREQGITIDVAYRYFSTARRAFIVADTPGHEQYTRNMATGASTADLAILLVDARKGILPQTRRHAFIASMLGIRHVVLAVNKMDIVGYDRAVFERIAADFQRAAKALAFSSIQAIALSARHGDNVASRSQNMSWYQGPSLLEHLESVDTGAAMRSAGFAMPVQWVNRPDQAFRGFAGTIAAGEVRPGDEIALANGTARSRVARIVTADGDLQVGVAGQAVTLTLADEIDVSRGDVLTGGRAGAVRQHDRIRAHVFWAGQVPALRGGRYLIKTGAAMAQAEIAELHHVTNIENYQPQAAGQIAMNGFGLLTLALDKSVAVADYRDVKALGGFILIDRYSNETVAIGMVDHAAPLLPGDQDARASTAPLMTRARLQFERRAGIAGSQKRMGFLMRASWQGVSALAVGLGVLAISGSFKIGIVAIMADLVFRPLLHRAHARLWQAGNGGTKLSGDGDGI